MRLKNKVAIITGAGSGIGKAMALLFAKEGASVVIATRSDDGLKVENEIKKKGGSALFVKTDVSDASSVHSMVNQVIKKFKRIDILVNNAGIMPGGTVETTSEQTWDDVMSINLKGIFLCSKFAIPHLRKTKNASIINIASEWGLSGGQNVVAYCASKGGVVNMTRAMALDHARVGIRVNCIAPGPIKTKMLTGFFDNDALKYIAGMVPLGRLGNPEEVANVALFLASVESSFVTGSVYSVDGGDMAGYYA